MQKNSEANKKIGKRQKKQLAIVTLILMVVSVIGVVLLTPGFNIKEIKVTGNTVIKGEEIISCSGIRKGVNIFDFNIGEAKKNILSMGYVSEVKIKRKLPSTVEINIVEEVGVSYIKAETGYVIITADGRCIDITDGIKNSDKDGKGTVEIPKMPIIKGLDDVKYKVGKVIKSENSTQLEVLFKCLHEFSKSGHIFNMIEIDMSNMNKIKFKYMTEDLVVSVGDAEKIDYKIEVFEEILAGIGQNPKGTIDLNQDRPTYTPLLKPTAGTTGRNSQE